MASYEYRALTLDGRIVEGTLDGIDDRSVINKLRDQGFLPIKVSAGRQGSVFSRSFSLQLTRKKVTGKELLAFTQELATLVKAGLPLDRSLSILTDLTVNAHFREVIRDVLDEVRGGKSLADSLAKHPRVFPKLYVNMVRAGEAGGVLQNILERLAEYLESSQDLKNYFVSSLIYPALLALVGSASIIVLILFVIPQFTLIFENAGAPMPLPMKILLAFSDFLRGWWWFLLLGMGSLFVFTRQYLMTEPGRLNWDRRVLRLPVVGPLVRKMEVARFSRTLGILLRSSVPLLNAMTIVKEIVYNQAIASTMDSIKSGIKKGEGISAPIREANVFPPFALHLVEVGEETGSLDAMMLQIADTYDKEVRNSLKQLIAFFEPAMILIMGLIIGTMVVSMLTAIFSINEVPL
ncbi:MAG: type II secretion system inner membrane protein GspF [Acidobacteria bacterium]|nr:type II secretion system inner membrane protein GspF [Acidobacteriota bacterium]